MGEYADYEIDSQIDRMTNFGPRLRRRRVSKEVREVQRQKAEKESARKLFKEMKRDGLPERQD